MEEVRRGLALAALAFAKAQDNSSAEEDSEDMEDRGSGGVGAEDEDKEGQKEQDDQQRGLTTIGPDEPRSRRRRRRRGDTRERVAMRTTRASRRATRNQGGRARSGTGG